MKKIKIALSGIGNRALPKNPKNSNWLGWVELINRSGNFQLVAAHDISKEATRRIIERGYLKPAETYTSLEEMLRKVPCEALLISNPSESHAETIKKALKYNLHLLIEKPFVNDLREGNKLINLIERKGVIVSIVQNWRTKDVGKWLYNIVQSGKMGKIGHILFRYIRDRENPNYPKYIFEEKFPLLYAMGIHHLDLFRYILKDDFVSVRGSSFKPPWSMYKSDTGMNLFLKTRKGVSVIYSGTVSSRTRLLPQESLIIEGEYGTLVNESVWSEPPLWFYPREKKEKIDITAKVKEKSIAGQYNLSDEYILKNFYKSILGKEKPICSAKDGLKSIALLEGSRLACESGKVINI